MLQVLGFARRANVKRVRTRFVGCWVFSQTARLLTCLDMENLKFGSEYYRLFIFIQYAQNS